MMTAERARELFIYDPETGVITRRISIGGSPAGAVVGHPSQNGYLRVCASRRSYAAHRVAWLIMTGDWPDGDVDHIDMDRRNNRWENLRCCSRSENMHNTKARKGIKGISWDRANCKWRASAHIRGKSLNLGRYACLGAAIAAYRSACRAAYGDFARFA